MGSHHLLLLCLQGGREGRRGREREKEGGREIERREKEKERKRKRGGRRESMYGISGASSYKDTNPLGSGPHSYDLL